MSQVIPIYKEHGKTYHADTCEPLVRAVKAGKVQLNALVRGGYPGKRLRPHDLTGIRSIGFWDAIGQQDWGLEYHRNEGIEITFLETGSMPFLVEEKEYLLKPDNLTITRPWQPHRVGNPHIHAGRLYWVILDVGVRRPNQSWKWPKWLSITMSDLNDLTTMLRHNEQPVWNGNPDIRNCFQKIGIALSSINKNRQISHLTVYLNEIFLLLLELIQQSNIKLNPNLSSAQRTVELFLQDLLRNIENLSYNWTVKEMAEHCGLGLTQFIHCCKQLTNMTPLQFLNYHRVVTASRLLIENPGISITEVALTCGFCTSQYFAAVFKNQLGMTPKAYRKKAH